MANGTTMSSPLDEPSKQVAITVILPTLFALVLAILILIAFVLPRITTQDSATKEDRRKKRLATLDKWVKAQQFSVWASKQNEEHPDTVFAMSPLCVICLDQIEDASQIRGLECLHVFHQQCLDDWFARYNEFCPLCHRPIIQAANAPTRSRQVPRPYPSMLATMA